jgi:predicted nucleic acid-binding protein
MTEQLLQYIWQFQYFNLNELTTAEGERVTIVHRGTHNKNQGPDFLKATIKIGDTTWVGNIELHVNSSHWVDHQHSGDKNYKNIILHVVWKNDKKLDMPFPVLELQSRVSKLLLGRYSELMKTGTFIPCEKNIQQADQLTWMAWKERLLVERLQEKSAIVLQYLAESTNHWEEVFWWLLARNFGMKVNSEAFEKIARSVPVNILAKHKNQVQQLEAMLLGQAGLLQGDFTDPYVIMLQKEYAFLQKKYRLTATNIPVHQLRMRPSNFPAVRLAQLAMLVHNSSHLFSKIIAMQNVKELKQLLDITANDFWHYHYVPDEASDYKEKKVGTQMVENILINTIAPVLFAYAQHTRENHYKDKALQWLGQITAEKNIITKGYAALGVEVKTALDSQALIQLKNYYCNHKRCLECAVGNKILKAPSSPQ